MRVQDDSKNKNNPCISFDYFSCDSSFATTFTKEFERPDGTHKVKIDIYKENNGETKNAKITASEYVKDKNLWSLVDYINNCPLDINMALIKGSFEIKKINDSFDAVLFSYTIGCVGGLDPVAVKYFEFRDGVKYSLRGGKHIIVGDYEFGGEKVPVPDFNLQNDKSLLKYMTKKWTSISSFKIN